MPLLYTTVPTKTLGASISASAAAFTLNNIEGWSGSNLVAGDFGTVAYGVFRNSTGTQLELFSWDPTTIASATITILKRGLNFTGDLTTELTARKYAWVKGDTRVDLGTDTPQLFQFLKEYIDGVAIAGSPDAALATKGISKLSVAPISSTSPIAVGQNDFAVLNSYAADAGASDTYVVTLSPVPTTYTTGMTVNFKANTINTGAATLNVNSLGAKTIKKNVAQDLQTGDILANQLVSVVYDGTNFQMTSPPPQPTIQLFTNTGGNTWTKPTGLSFIEVEIWGGGGGGGGVAAAAPNTASGGGGGAYIITKIQASVLGATETVTIGVGGTGGTAASGGVGGNSTFGSLITSYGADGGGSNTTSTTGSGGGGQFGQSSSTTAGSPGSPIVGTGGAAGSVGGSAIDGGAGGGGSTTAGATGAGGKSINGGGGGGGSRNGAASAGGTSINGGSGGAGNGAGSGTAGSQPGGGGGGGTGGSGGNGGAGMCRVIEYYQ